MVGPQVPPPIGLKNFLKHRVLGLLGGQDLIPIGALILATGVLVPTTDRVTVPLQ